MLAMAEVAEAPLDGLNGAADLCGARYVRRRRNDLAGQAPGGLTQGAQPPRYQRQRGAFARAGLGNSQADATARARHQDHPTFQFVHGYGECSLARIPVVSSKGRKILPAYALRSRTNLKNSARVWSQSRKIPSM